MDAWGWQQLSRWMPYREELPTGYVFPIIRGENAGIQQAEYSIVRKQLETLGHHAGVRKRCAWHQFRHGFSIEFFFIEGGNILALQRQLGHAHLGVTERYLRGIDTMFVTETIADRAAPMIVLT